jgi:uncharacterized protein YbjT (DUF2867 family)
LGNALIAGATGLIGSQLVGMLAEDGDYDQVIVLSRRPVKLDLAGAEVVVIDFDQLQETLPRLLANRAPDDIFCCLGTTIAKAGSQAEFRKVDYHYCLQLAKVGRELGARHFLLVSAMGANPSSRNFYSRTKGELEQEVESLGYPQLTIFRPSLLDGDRSEKRMVEQLALSLLRPLQGITEKLMPAYAPIAATQVAQAMQKAADATSDRGVSIINSDRIRRLALS